MKNKLILIGKIGKIGGIEAKLLITNPIRMILYINLVNRNRRNESHVVIVEMSQNKIIINHNKYSSRIIKHQ